MKKAVPDDSYGTRIEIDQEKCIGCSKCVMYCPHGAINMIG